ncbi:esterase-like [Prosopis cineraria]|uniref:esterase-like n=1 Tax=Prosopis cineraria TaxID=364024 RepID=UPI00240F31D4|nr:esterase-like [Prosopis cineraria]
MESLGYTMSRISFSRRVLLLCLATTLLNPAFGTPACEFPAIFNFGDSNSDTGGIAAAFLAPPKPYGQTYFERPSGRVSDGRLIIDFVAQNFGLPHLSAYLNSLGVNFTHGANFATAGSSIKPPPCGDQFSPFFLDLQFNQFTEFKNKTQFIRRQGGIFGSLIPKEKHFVKALYTFDIGQNDLGAAIHGNKTLQEIKASIPDTVNSFSANVKNIYNLGARYFWIHNTGPIGCLPYTLVRISGQRDESGCVKPYNELAQYFNYKLKEAVVQLRKDLPHAVITYVDIYSAKYSLISNAKKYGFEEPIVACCGYGGEYNYGIVQCGRTKMVNGTEIYAGSCEKPSVRVNWDGIHYTEAANKFIFDQISTGAFSDPPVPLNMACHRH